MSTNVVTLSPEVADELASLADRLGLSPEETLSLLIRDRLTADIVGPRVLPFAALGGSGRSDISSRMEELLRDEWGDEIQRHRG